MSKTKYEILAERECKVYDYKPTYDEVRDFIGGYIEGITLSNGDRMYVDEEGLLKEINFLNETASVMAQREIVGYAVVIPKEHCGEDW